MRRTVIGQDTCGMPGPHGTVDFSVVLVEQGGFASAYMGATLNAQWIADRGAPVDLERAKLHFPNLDNDLQARGLRYARGEA